MEIYQMSNMYTKEMVDQWCSKTDISSIIFFFKFWTMVEILTQKTML